MVVVASGVCRERRWPIRLNTRAERGHIALNGAYYGLDAFGLFPPSLSLSAFVLLGLVCLYCSVSGFWDVFNISFHVLRETNCFHRFLAPQMAMSVKAPTPIRSAPSSAPLEAMVAKQQSHIEDLVMQNRTLEQMVQKLRAEVTADQSRHDSTLQQLKQQFGIERIEWKSAADSLQSLWRIVYLRAVAELEKERSNVFKMREEVRLGRVARLQRDYRIGMFQTREMELEDRVAEFQEQFEDMRSSYEEEHKKRLDQKEQFRESVLELNEVVGERDQLEVRALALRLNMSHEHHSVVMHLEIIIHTTQRAHCFTRHFGRKFHILGACHFTGRRTQVQSCRITGEVCRS